MKRVIRVILLATLVLLPTVALIGCSSEDTKTPTVKSGNVDLNATPSGRRGPGGAAGGGGASQGGVTKK